MRMYWSSRRLSIPRPDHECGYFLYLPKFQHHRITEFAQRLINCSDHHYLGQEIDQITLINVAQGVQGIARARILYFNVTGNGSILSIHCPAKPIFQPNNLIINTESI